MKYNLCDIMGHRIIEANSFDEIKAYAEKMLKFWKQTLHEHDDFKKAEILEMEWEMLDLLNELKNNPKSGKYRVMYWNRIQILDD